MFILVGMILAVIVMFTLEPLRAVAFQLIVACVSAALGFLFGSKRKRD